ncbi:WD repeat-containing protein 74 [Ricinus communis]|uniref:WD-repeat protein, putative n=1 Tax=Ricinus communis TaxID=3988 RepID=B9RAJ5_RICCO|nr:WD repeat-containing protein 74 [Ricinus communis]EEF51822.1 WD-repeat protein, putative [Ricinus communis]|eukprot:XP_002511220.1 WD repeat-containing protein 74 [Ricinus communis]
MPRTTTVETPGCPQLRALTFDALGFTKVIESRGDRGIPQVVQRWGDPDPSKCVLAVSIDDHKQDPLLAVGRKDGVIEVMNTLNGQIQASISNVGDADAVKPQDDAVAGLHLFRRQRLSGSCNLLTCTMKGNASIRPLEFNGSSADNASSDGLRNWKVCASGNIFCSKVDGSENYALFGGKSVELNLWDLEKCSRIWNAKSPPKNSLGIFTPTWFTSATFLSNDDHRKFAAGTSNHQVRLYDTSALRRPVISFDFREAPIKAVTEDQDGYTIYIGNGSGDLASVDIRTGKLLGCFLGKCSGSIRSIARHPELPLIGSCGLDSYLRLWDIKTRQLLSAVFLKQHLTNVVFDSSFSEREVEVESQNSNVIQHEDEIGSVAVKRKEKSKEKKGDKKKASKGNDGKKRVKI